MPNLIPVVRELPADLETPVSAFLKLRGPADAPDRSPAFLLESAEQGQRVGRYSFIGVHPRKVVRWSLGGDGDPYALAQDEAGRYRQAPLPDLPPFAGGAVGYFGYDLVRTVEPLGDPNPDPVGLPDMALMLGSPTSACMNVVGVGGSNASGGGLVSFSIGVDWCRSFEMARQARNHGMATLAEDLMCAVDEVKALNSRDCAGARQRAEAAEREKAAAEAPQPATVKAAFF